ncbi:DUF2892 domain-containing protein [Candidatus Acetothermia bacterium]|jgi:hypothetical protein|nr:DUF2892 domain-containing protein [Candidatus Acetothermia bacterium]MCI2431757.1 DUF2892 domain-containing protein [Candidatus Acetothermia bacterium]MCI2436759.1 DUF2892 domain-containing protein [Candidatus Acetothermia bacterium]
MQKNLAGCDRAIRTIVGIVLFILGGWTWGGWQGTWYGIVSLIVGIVLVGTALVGFCPCYWACRGSTLRQGK